MTSLLILTYFQPYSGVVVFFCCWIWTGTDLANFNNKLSFFFFGIITWCQAKPVIWFFSKSDELNCFCGMVDQRKTFSLISSRDHCQRSSPWTWVQNLSAEPQFRLSWISCAVAITTTPFETRSIFNSINFFFF